MRRARLARYSLWQMLDFALHRGAALVIIGALLLLQIKVQLRAMTGSGRLLSDLPPRILLLGGWGIFWSFAFIAVLMSVNGMVSGDRRLGYYRFLFSKPLSPAAFYASSFGVALLGVLLASSLMHLAVWWIGVRLPVQVLLAVAPLYVLMGAIGFLFSTVMTREWVGILGVLVATAYLKWRAGEVGGLVESVARYLLPPIHLGDVFRDAVLAGGMPPTEIILWPLAYGLAVLGLGLLILHRRPLA